MDERQERVGRNEALFRVINDRIEGLNEAFAGLTDDLFEIVCECGVMDCLEQIEIPTHEYERVRADPTLFVVRPGHEDAVTESIVDVHGAYVIVRKHPGEPADRAGRTAS